MKKFFLLFVATLVFVSCKEEVKHDVNPFPQIPETCKVLLPNKEPQKITGSTGLLRVKLHFGTFLLHQDGALVSNEFERYKNLTETTLQIISVKDLKSSIQEAKKRTKGYKISFIDDHLVSAFEEQGMLFIRTDGQLHSYKLDGEMYFLQLIRGELVGVTYNWFPISNPIWEY